MRVLPTPALQAISTPASPRSAAAGGSTRRDGVVLGFTDHDRDLALRRHRASRPRTGFTASEIDAALGLAVDGLEASPARCRPTGLTRGAICGGRYDDARGRGLAGRLEDVGAARAAARGTLGEVRARGAWASPPSCAALAASRWTSRGAASIRPWLRRRSRRRALRRRSRRSAFATARCRGARADAARHRRERARRLRRRLVRARHAGLGRAAPMPGGWREVKAHRATAARDRRAVAAAWPRPIAAGDAFAVTAGCDKRFATCRDEFANGVNFRGFPHMPGNDFVTRAMRRRASPTMTAGACSHERPAHASSPRRAAGSARPIGIRPRSRASAAIASGWCAASGARCMGDEPEAPPAYRAGLGRGAAAARRWREAARRHLRRRFRVTEFDAGRRAAVPLARGPAGEARRHRCGRRTR